MGKSIKLSQKIKQFNFRPEMSIWFLLGLALLSVPRVIAHDLDLLDFNSLPYILLAIVPYLIYAAVAIFRDNKRPFYDFLLMGLMFGILLATVHYLTWDVMWGDNPPRLGDNLEGVLSIGMEQALFKATVIKSSIMTGIGIGVIFGGIAVLARKVRARKRRS